MCNLYKKNAPEVGHTIDFFLRSFNFYLIYFESPLFKALEISFIIFQLDLLIILGKLLMVFKYLWM